MIKTGSLFKKVWRYTSNHSIYIPSMLIIALLLFIYRHDFSFLKETSFVTFEWLNRYYKEIIHDKLFIAFIFGYIITGIVADLLLREYSLWIWKKTSKSYLSMGFSLPVSSNPAHRKEFSWAPRRIGILERIFYTSSIAFNQHALIGVWLVFKAIGEWSDDKASKLVLEASDNNRSEKIWTGRVRANNFLIGNGMSLIFGILGGIIFKTIVEKNYLAKMIFN